jgi:hypothetical protein
MDLGGARFVVSSPIMKIEKFRKGFDMMGCITAGYSPVVRR